MSEFTLESKKRTDEGKGASRRLRLSGVVPAIVYGGNSKPVSLEVDHNMLWNMLEDERIFTTIITLKIDGKAEKVIIKDLQRHPFANKINHIDFQRLDEKRMLTKKVPLSFDGVEKSAAVKLGALLTPLMSTVEVRCLPKDLPESINIDCSMLESGVSMKMSDVQLPKGVDLVALRKGGTEYDHAVLIVGKVR